jgi:hypothetical protein
MRIIVRSGLALAVSVLLARLAPAQIQPADRGYLNPVPIVDLLSNASVQEELKLSDEQVTRLQKIPQELRIKNKKKWDAIFKQYQAYLKDADRVRKKIETQTRTAILAVFKPEQANRLRQIELQALGTRAFEQDDVQKALKLTERQKEHLKLIQGVLDMGIRFDRGMTFQMWLDKLESLNRSSLEKMQGKLSTDQKMTWTKLIGDPFPGLRRLSLRGLWFSKVTSERVGTLPLTKSVQEELKLGEEQVAQITKIPVLVKVKNQEELDRVAKERQKYFTSTGGLTRTTQDETIKRMLDILKPEQRRRLRQIEIQQAGMDAFTREDVQKQLKLTSEQKKDIRAISDDIFKQIVNARKELLRNPQKVTEVRRKLVGLRKTGMEKMISQLTDPQRKIWKAMAGPPFELKPGTPKRRN